MRNTRSYLRVCAWGLMALSAVTWGCGSSEPTGEFDNVAGAAVFGTVTRNGAPAGGVAVRICVLRPCEFDTTPPGTFPVEHPPVVTDEAGRYRQGFVSIFRPEFDACLLVTALLETNGVSDSVSIRGVPIHFSLIGFADAPVRDSVRVDIVLPE